MTSDMAHHAGFRPSLASNRPAFGLDFGGLKGSTGGSVGELIGAVVTLVLGLVFLALGIVVYFIPWVAALWNNHPDDKAIGLLNLFLGWTFIGWVAALVWAYKKPASAKP